MSRWRLLRPSSQILPAHRFFVDINMLLIVATRTKQPANQVFGTNELLLVLRIVQLLLVH